MASERKLCMCVFVDQRFPSWQRSGAVSHRQHFRNVPQHRDGLWSLISRASSPRGLSACVRHSPAQTHTGEAALSCGWFSCLCLTVWHLSGFFICLNTACWVTCLIVRERLFHCLTSAATCVTLKEPVVGSRVIFLCPVSLYSQLTPVCFPPFSVSSGETIQEKEIYFSQSCTMTSRCCRPTLASAQPKRILCYCCMAFFFLLPKPFFDIMFKIEYELNVCCAHSLQIRNRCVDFSCILLLS